MTSPWILHVRRTVDVMRSLDPECEVFGARRHRWTWTGATTAGQVAERERALGIELPEPYRTFILELGSSGAGPNYGIEAFEPLRSRRLPCDEEELVVIGADGAPASVAVPEVSDPTRPFVVDDVWFHEYEEESPARFTIRAGSHPHDGCVTLTEVGCGGFERLVVTGSMAGRVLSDCMAPGGTFEILEPFDRWYEHWLNESVREAGLGRSEQLLGGAPRREGDTADMRVVAEAFREEFDRTTDALRQCVLLAERAQVLFALGDLAPARESLRAARQQAVLIHQRPRALEALEAMVDDPKPA